MSRTRSILTASTDPAIGTALRHRRGRDERWVREVQLTLNAQPRLSGILPCSSRWELSRSSLSASDHLQPGSEPGGASSSWRSMRYSSSGSRRGLHGALSQRTDADGLCPSPPPRGSRFIIGAGPPLLVEIGSMRALGRTLDA